MKVKRILTILAFIFIVSNSYSQSYNTGIGVRLGYFNGVTAKHFIHSNRAIEGIISSRWKGLIITGMYEYQNPLTGIPNFDWYIGGGCHVGFWGDGDYDEENDDSYTIIGVDFVVGLEYIFRTAPFTLTFDWKPAVNLIGDTNWWGDGFSLSARYRF